jgi:glycosyltransferase involved in cell wall biosynthesis
VSVVIAAYNAGRTLGETLESVRAQTFEDLEVIIVDDGSTDATPAVAVSTGDRRVRLLSQPNAGVSAARNRGADDARGRYLAFLDADDLWTPDKLASQVAALERDKDAGLAYSWTAFIDPGGRRLPGGITVRRDGWVFDDLVLGCFVGNGSSALVRRSAFDAVGGFDVTLRTADDWDFYLRLARKYPFVCVPFVQVFYRVDRGSKSFRLRASEEGSLRVIERVFADARREQLPLKRTAIANMYAHLLNRALQEPLTRQRALEACRFAWKLASVDARRLPPAGILARNCTKLAAALVLPAGLGNGLYAVYSWVTRSPRRRPFGGNRTPDVLGPGAR